MTGISSIAELALRSGNVRCETRFVELPLFQPEFMSQQADRFGPIWVIFPESAFGGGELIGIKILFQNAFQIPVLAGKRIENFVKLDGQSGQPGIASQPETIPDAQTFAYELQKNALRRVGHIPIPLDG